MNHQGEAQALGSILLSSYGAGISAADFDRNQLHRGSRCDEPEAVPCEVAVADLNGVIIESLEFDSISAATHFALVTTRDHEGRTATVVIEDAAPVLVYCDGACIHHYERQRCDVCDEFVDQLVELRYPANAERGPSKFMVCRSCGKDAHAGEAS